MRHDDSSPTTYPGTAGMLRFVDRHFSAAMTFTRFALNALLVSAAGIIAFLIVYVASIPGFRESLAADGMAREYLLRQVLLNGLPVVYLINHVGFSLYVWLARQEAVRLGAVRAFVIDLPARLALFIIAHAAIYAGAARLFGSFGGDAMQALGAVGPTIAQSASFGNLSGVYLYATAASAYPLFIAAARQLMIEHEAKRNHNEDSALRWPLRMGSLAGLSVLFGVIYVLFAFAVSGAAMLLA